jgi:hypothetical protein
MVNDLPACGAPVDGGRCGRAPDHEGHPHIMEPGSDVAEVAVEIYCCEWITYPVPGTDSVCPGCGSRFSVSPALTSEAAYEAAAARFNEISETIGPRRKALERELVALEAEWEAAQAGLRAHELKPGIPLWPTMPGGPRYQGSPE